MKAKHSIILLIASYCFDFLGTIIKILHYPYGNEILILATVLKVAGALLLLYKISTYPKLKDFWDW